MDCRSIHHRVYARIGLLGNPSDAYFGHTLAFSVSNFWASVTLVPSCHLIFEPHPHHDLCRFTSLAQMVGRVQAEGYYGGVRLQMAACKSFHRYCSSHKIQLHNQNFTLSYDTNIPRQAGLSGSSAIVCATINCLLEYYGVGDNVKMEDRPRIVLNAEEELGITAGLQDRVAQVYGGLVYMDFEKDHMQRTGNGIYTPLDASLLPPLFVIYAENPSDSGKVHSNVRKRWLEGDAFVCSKMREVADLAVKGRVALLEHDYTTFAKLMNLNFDLRRKMFGDDVLGETNIKMVETARSVGAACKFTGSGGAAVAYCPEGPSQAQQLMVACEKAGFKIELLVVAPAVVEPCSSM